MTTAAIVSGGVGGTNTITTSVPDETINDTSSAGTDGLAYGGSGSLIISGQGGSVPGYSVGGKSLTGIIGTTADASGVAGASWGAGASGSCNATGGSNTNGAAGYKGCAFVWEYKL